MFYGLLVEADKSICEMINYVLKDEIRLMCVKDYEAAMKHIGAFRFDLIIIDMHTINLKVDILKHIPKNSLVYLLTTYAKPSDLSITVISKPFDIEKIENIPTILKKRVDLVQ